MRRPKITLKIYYYITIICALLLIYLYNNKFVREYNKNKINKLQNYSELDELQINPSPEYLVLISKNTETLRRPWFFKQGEYYPKPAKTLVHQRGKNAHLKGSHLFPYQDPYSDRIINQLMYVPPNYEEVKASGKLKTILLYNKRHSWDVEDGRHAFRKPKCPVDTCTITRLLYNAKTADLVIYRDILPNDTHKPDNSRQIKMLYQLESPNFTNDLNNIAVNWTSTYRRDSDIVAPYGKWLYFDPRIREREQDRNYAAKKLKKVAWFVSNCFASNNRLQFAFELAKYIEVDIYGACGNYKCPRAKSDKCFEMLDRNYKFYLAFENSNCRDYVTEKFFVNALNRNILPIVMGARPEDYGVIAPERSYIHVDEFLSIKELADYLHKLDKDDELYNSYFKWKGTGEIIETYYWCRVCAVLHDEESLNSPHWYADVNEWWKGKGECTKESWRNLTES